MRPTLQAGLIYHQGLQQGNPEMLMSLIPSTHLADDVVAQKIEQFGGLTLYEVRITYIQPEFPTTVPTLISAKYRGQDGSIKDFDERLYLQEIDQRWYLLLGQFKGIDKV